MYVATRKRVHKNKVYTSSQIVEGYRTPDGKVRQRVLLDISKLGEEKIAAVKAALQGKAVVDWDSLEGLEALDFGIPFVVEETLKSLGLPEILGEEGGKYYPTILAMIANRLDRPCAKYSLRHWVRKTTLVNYPGIDPRKAFHHDTCYETLDYLEEKQEFVEEELYRRREKPTRLLLYDITSSYFEGRKAELARFGYSRDHRGDRRQIVIGLVTDSDGLPICVEVFEGNTKDGTTVIGKVNELKSRFGVRKACFVGDRGMKTEANIEHILDEGLDFILALSHREVLKLVEENGPRQMGLFDERGVAEVTTGNRRLVVCRNPIAGEDTKRRRDELLKLTEEALEKIRSRVGKGRLKKPDAIRKAVDRYFAKWKMEKFFRLTIEPGSFVFERDSLAIKSAAQLDGVYVIETSLSPEEMPKEEVQSSYKLLQVVERAFRATKDELCIRPVYHWKESRIRGHVFLCMLAYLVERRLQMGIESLPETERPGQVGIGCLPRTERPGQTGIECFPNGGRPEPARIESPRGTKGLEGVGIECASRIERAEKRGVQSCSNAERPKKEGIESGSRIERPERAKIEPLSSVERPEWKEVISALSGWRRISVYSRPALRAHHPGFTPQIASWLSCWNIPIPG